MNKEFKLELFPGVFCVGFHTMINEHGYTVGFVFDFSACAPSEMPKMGDMINKAVERLRDED